VRKLLEKKEEIKLWIGRILAKIMKEKILT
jgi:hypothetical protein